MSRPFASVTIRVTPEVQATIRNEAEKRGITAPQILGQLTMALIGKPELISELLSDFNKHGRENK